MIIALSLLRCIPALAGRLHKLNRPERVALRFLWICLSAGCSGGSSSDVRQTGPGSLAKTDSSRSLVRADEVNLIRIDDLRELLAPVIENTKGVKTKIDHAKSRSVEAASAAQEAVNTAQVATTQAAEAAEKVETIGDKVDWVAEKVIVYAGIIVTIAVAVQRIHRRLKGINV